jgi:anaerobic dimethyl sulfoxide reductase subunit B (iron-sulfur subunit)
MARQKAFHFDNSACIGCKTCQIACKDKKSNPLGVNFRRVIEYGGGSWSTHPVHKGALVPVNFFGYFLSIACMHCAKPICVEVCPSGAMQKREADGVVFVDQKKCLGCRLCEQSCPYHAPQFNKDLGVMSKCDMCLDLQEKNQPPSCVASCPQRALSIGELKELREKFGTVDAVEPLPKASFTEPSVVITPHPKVEWPGAGTGKILNPTEV